ncbi:MAG: hypothetical protein AAF378_05980 [Cyanobacteria bacterium P01_A01_bin.84]
MKQSPSIAIATLRYAPLAMINIQLILSEYLKSMTGIEKLRYLHTKQLIQLKNECFKSLNWSGHCLYDDVVITSEDLKQVLSERPHIPNRAETKIIRRKAVKLRERGHMSIHCRRSHQSILKIKNVYI